MGTAPTYVCMYVCVYVYVYIEVQQTVQLFFNTDDGDDDDDDDDGDDEDDDDDDDADDARACGRLGHPTQLKVQCSQKQDQHSRNWRSLPRLIRYFVNREVEHLKNSWVKPLICFYSFSSKHIKTLGEF